MEERSSRGAETYLGPCTEKASAVAKKAAMAVTVDSFMVAVL
jgi:hypothetical protein